MQRPGVADAGGAAVADDVEAELVEIGCSPVLLEVIGDHARAGRERSLDRGSTVRPRSTAFFASKPAASITLGLLVFVQLVIAAIKTLP